MAYQQQQPQSNPAPQTTQPQWRKWNPNSPAPKPDLEDYRLKACYRCKSEQMDIVEATHSSGTKQFKGECMSCREKTGALPFARDAESLGFNVMFFGKHKGKTLAAVREEDPEYLSWCLDNLTDVKMLGTIVLYQRATQ